MPHARAALSAYAVMTHFPVHKFEMTTDFYCSICAQREISDVDVTFVNKCRWNGSLVGREPIDLAIYIRQNNEDEVINPSEDDVDIFLKILDEISASPANETPSTLFKRVRKIPGIKMSLEESR